MFKFIYRLLKNLGVLFFISIPLEVTGLLVLFPVVIFSDIGSLPYIFRWFDGADHYVGRNTEVVDKINSGINTDYSFFQDPSNNLSKIKIIINKYMWLAWRNPCNYFGYKYLGAQINVPIVMERVFIQTVSEEYKSFLTTGYEIGNTTFDIPGNFYQEFTSNNKTYYEYYYIKKYTIFNKSVCVRFRMGWKIGQNTLAQSNKWCQGVCAVQPWMGYWGK